MYGTKIWKQYTCIYLPHSTDSTALRTFLFQPFSTLGPRALARARCAHVPHLSAPARLLGSWVFGVILKVQHVQHLG